MTAIDDTTQRKKDILVKRLLFHSVVLSEAVKGLKDMFVIITLSKGEMINF